MQLPLLLHLERVLATHFLLQTNMHEINVLLSSIYVFFLNKIIYFETFQPVKVTFSDWLPLLLVLGQALESLDYAGE
jgi:hypothetical protein